MTYIREAPHLRARRPEQCASSYGRNPACRGVAWDGENPSEPWHERCPCLWHVHPLARPLNCPPTSSACLPVGLAIYCLHAVTCRLPVCFRVFLRVHVSATISTLNPQPNPERQPPPTPASLSAATCFSNDGKNKPGLCDEGEVGATPCNRVLPSLSLTDWRGSQQIALLCCAPCRCHCLLQCWAVWGFDDSVSTLTGILNLFDKDRRVGSASTPIPCPRASPRPAP